MEDRRDAALGAASFSLAAREVVMEGFPECVTNVGDMRFAPGVFNIVPGRVSVALEFRAQDRDSFERLEQALLQRAEVEARRFDLGLEVEWLGKSEPTPTSDVARRAVADAAAALGLSQMTLPSGAGHDAQSLAEICPVGMVFVPSVGGASHSPREFTRWEDCVSGANVLLQAALRMALSLSRTDEAGQ
jgi:N-carbamoyl-L-amino-acid hydrolase